MLKIVLLFISCIFCVFVETAVVSTEKQDIEEVIQNYVKSVSENLELNVAIIITRRSYFPDGTWKVVDTLAFSSAQENKDFDISAIGKKSIDKLQKDAEDNEVLISLSHETYSEEGESTTKNFHTDPQEIPDSVAAYIAAAGRDEFQQGLVEEVANTLDMTVTEGTIQLIEYHDNGKVRRNRTSTLYPQKVVTLKAEKVSAKMQQEAETEMKKAFKIDVDNRAPIIAHLFDKKFPAYSWQVLVNATHYWIDDNDAVLILKVGNDVFDIVGTLRKS